MNIFIVLTMKHCIEDFSVTTCLSGHPSFKQNITNRRRPYTKNFEKAKRVRTPPPRKVNLCKKSLAKQQTKNRKNDRQIKMGQHKHSDSKFYANDYYHLHEWDFDNDNYDGDSDCSYYDIDDIYYATGYHYDFCWALIGNIN